MVLESEACTPFDGNLNVVVGEDLEVSYGCPLVILQGLILYVDPPSKGSRSMTVWAIVVALVGGDILACDVAGRR